MTNNLMLRRIKELESKKNIILTRRNIINILFMALLFFFNDVSAQSKMTDLNSTKRKNSLLKKAANSQKSKTPNKIKKKLRYLYYSNGGIRGYFDDGTIVGCPRCDFIKSNVLNLYNKKPIGKYKVLPDGSLLTDNSEQEFPNYNKDDGWFGWPLIDFKWYEKIPQN